MATLVHNTFSPILLLAFTLLSSSNNKQTGKQVLLFEIFADTR